jgi:hypothetical protein
MTSKVLKEDLHLFLYLETRHFCTYSAKTIHDQFLGEWFYALICPFSHRAFHNVFLRRRFYFKSPPPSLSMCSGVLVESWKESDLRKGTVELIFKDINSLYDFPRLERYVRCLLCTFIAYIKVPCCFFTAFLYSEKQAYWKDSGKLYRLSSRLEKRKAMLNKKNWRLKASLVKCA